MRPPTSGASHRNSRSSTMRQSPSLSPFKHFKHDLPAGIVVALVALPLCLGIAFASNAPLISGLVAGIVGGIIVAALSKSPLAVTGPAAGLTVIVVNAIFELGSYEAFLAAVVLSGAMQIAMGFLRAGRIAHYFPISVIKGMLAGIGAVLILKQIPHAFGYDGDFEGDLSFAQADGRNTLTEIPYALGHFHLGATLLSFASLAILIWWPKISKKVSLIPAPLLVVILGIGFNALFEAYWPELSVREHLLVGVPVTESISALYASLPTPDFSGIMEPAVWKVAAVVALVASVETLLCVEAIDRLDPFKRVSPPDRELKAQGAGNMLSGLLGGLPVTAVIVRGSANVQSGGRTQMSAVFHGLLLFASVLLIPDLLNEIPLAALAAVLLHVGYKLMPLSLFRGMYAAGHERLVPFLITFVGILFTDLLTGVGLGLVAGVIYVLRAHVSDAIRIQRKGELDIEITLGETVSFLHKAKVRGILDGIPDGAKVTVRAKDVLYLDREVEELIKDFVAQAPERDIKVEMDAFGVKPESEPEPS